MTSGPAAQWAPTSLSSPGRGVRELPSRDIWGLEWGDPWVMETEWRHKCQLIAPKSPFSWCVQLDRPVVAFL